MFPARLRPFAPVAGGGGGEEAQKAQKAQTAQNRTRIFVTETTERGHRGSRRRADGRRILQEEIEGTEAFSRGGPAAPRAAEGWPQRGAKGAKIGDRGATEDRQGGPAAPRAADRRGDALSRARSARPTPEAPNAARRFLRRSPASGGPAAPRAADRRGEAQESEADCVAEATALGHRGGRRRAKNRNSGKRRRTERGGGGGARSDQRPAIAASYSALVRSV